MSVLTRFCVRLLPNTQYVFLRNLSTRRCSQAVLRAFELTRRPILEQTPRCSHVATGSHDQTASKPAAGPERSGGDGMLKRNGVGRLNLRWGPTGLALGTRQAPLCLGHRGGRLGDGDGQFLRAIRAEGVGALVARPGRLRLELWRHRLCLHPAVVCLWTGEPLGRLAGGPLRRPPHDGAGGLVVPRGDVAHGHHDPPVAVLPVLRRPAGHGHDGVPESS